MCFTGERSDCRHARRFSCRIGRVNGRTALLGRSRGIGPCCSGGGPETSGYLQSEDTRGHSHDRSSPSPATAPAQAARGALYRLPSVRRWAIEVDVDPELDHGLGRDVAAPVSVEDDEPTTAVRAALGHCSRSRTYRLTAWREIPSALAISL